MLNLASHDQRDPHLSRNHKVIDELTSLVEQVCESTSTGVSTERSAFTTSSNALLAPVSSQSDPQIQFTPRVLSPEELAQAEDAFHFDLKSDFDETEFEEEACD